VLNTSRVLLLLIFCISQPVVTRLRCSWKYDISLVANLLLSPTVKEFLNWPTFLKVMNEYRVEWHVFMAHGVETLLKNGAFGPHSVFS